MTIGIGHNLSGESLKVFVERVERLTEEAEGINADKREVFAEAKSGGFNVKTLKKLIQERRMDPNDRVEQYELLDLYREAIGNTSRTPAPTPAREEDPLAAFKNTAATFPMPATASAPIAEAGAPSEEVEPSGGEPTAAEKAQGRAALGEGHEFDLDEPTREETDAETEQVPEQPAIEEEIAATAEGDPEIPGTPPADTTWTCAACGWTGVATMVTDECPDCGASTTDNMPGIPDFLDRSGELAG